MSTIQIADQIHPARATSDALPVQSDSVYQRTSTFPRARSGSIASEDAIQNIRSLPSLRDFRRRSSKSSELKDFSGEDDDPGLKRPSDYRQKQTFHGLQLAFLAYSSLGVIYGDIGTSPLYVFSSVFSAPPSHIDLLGALSLVIWTLTIVVSIKYVLVILCFDNNGEGGTFSMYALLSRYLDITNRDPREASLIEMKRYKSEELSPTTRHMRSGLEATKPLKILLKIIGVLAVTMVLADGVLTPAQSVLGAVQGIEVVQPNITTPVIIGVTDAILVLLFFIQPLGVSKISLGFSPVIVIWFILLLVFGIYNTAVYDATVWKAWNPYYAFDFLIRNKESGWRQLGGVLLCFTGVEALFADVSGFSRRAIQLSWLCFTFPCLLFAYIGQAAYISVHPDAYSNPLFKSVPGGKGVLYFTLVMAILAAIVASQAIITATFQLLAQVMKLSFFPQLKVVHTSKWHHGQLYIPVANWLLMIGTILVASVFNNTTSLGNAYGTCVMFVTFFDSCMVALAAIFAMRFSPYLVLPVWLVFACVDGTYLSSALTKVPDGAWVTIMIAVVLACVFMLWRFGKESQWAAEAEDRFPTKHFLVQTADEKLQLTGGVTELSRFTGLAIFFDKAGEMTPPVFAHFVQKLTAISSACIFLHLRPLEVPSIEPGERFSVSKLAFPNAYRLIVRYGYNDTVVSPDLAAIVYDQVRQYIIARGSDKPKPQDEVISNDIDHEKAAAISADYNESVQSQDDSRKGTDSPATRILLNVLDEAYTQKVLYVVGKEQMKLKPKTRIVRKVLLEVFLWLRDNTRGKIASLKIPAGDLIEIGFLKEI